MAHNGGRSQLNFWFPGHGDYIYLNRLKEASWWVYGNSSEFTLMPDDVNDQGYPTTDPGIGSLYCAMTIPSQANRSGNYVLRWVGSGTFSFHFSSGTLVSGSLSGSDGRAVFTPTDSPTTGGLYLRVQSPVSITSIAIVHVDDEAAWEANPNGFGVKFIERLEEANCGVYRFLDWLSANTAMINAWSQVKPDDYFSYAVDERRSSIYYVTTNVSDDYSIAGLPALTDKLTILAEWNATSSGTTPTLAGKTIKNPSGGALAASQKPASGKLSCLVFDEDLDCWLKTGGDSSLGDRGLSNGFPVETMVALCNELGAHPWFVQPYLDTEADYMSGLATYCQANLASGLIPRFEGPNEVWNTSSGFNGTPYAKNKANALWGASDEDQWYGRVVSVMGEAVSVPYSNDRAKYQVICGLWASDPNGETSLLQRITSPNYVLDGGDPATDWVTHISPAHYWKSSYTAQEELDAAHEWQSASAGDKLTIASAYVSTDQDVVISASIQNIARMVQIMGTWKTRADGYSMAIAPYEGGYDEIYPKVASNYTNYTPTPTAITRAAQAVVTVSAAFPVPPVGSSVLFASIGGMTELNGNTYEVTARDENAHTFTLDVDSSGFTAFTSGGTATYVSSGLYRTQLMEAGKESAAMQALTLSMYEQIVALGVEFPSQYIFCGEDVVWTIFDPNIYATASPAWAGIAEFNAVTPEPEPTFNLPRGGGSNRNKKKERKYVLEMDNKMYQVSSLEEARAILQSQPVQKKNKTFKLPKLIIELGEVSRVKVKNVPLVKALTMNVPLDWIEDAIQRIEDDEEEAVLLLLH
jgi:hypothetical protein